MATATTKSTDPTSVDTTTTDPSVDTLLNDPATTESSVDTTTTTTDVPVVEVVVKDAFGHDPLLTTDPKSTVDGVREIPYALSLVETPPRIPTLTNPTVDPSYVNNVETVEGGSNVENRVTDFDRLNKVPTAYSTPPDVDANVDRKSSDVRVAKE